MSSSNGLFTVDIVLQRLKNLDRDRNFGDSVKVSYFAILYQLLFWIVTTQETGTMVHSEESVSGQLMELEKSLLVTPKWRRIAYALAHHVMVQMSSMSPDDANRIDVVAEVKKYQVAFRVMVGSLIV